MMKPLFIRIVALFTVLAAGCPALTINVGSNHDRDRRPTPQQRDGNDRYAPRRTHTERHHRPEPHRTRPEPRRDRASGWERLLREELPKPARR